MSENNNRRVMVTRPTYHLSSSDDSSIDTQPDGIKDRNPKRITTGKSVTALLIARKARIDERLNKQHNALQVRVAGSKKISERSIHTKPNNGLSTPTNTSSNNRSITKRAAPISNWVSAASKKQKGTMAWHPVPKDFRPPYGYKLVPDESCPSPQLKIEKYPKKPPPLALSTSAPSAVLRYDPSGVLFSKKEEVVAAIASNKNKAPSASIKKVLGPTFDSVAGFNDKNQTKSSSTTSGSISKPPLLTTVFATKQEFKSGSTKVDNRRNDIPVNRSNTIVKTESKLDTNRPTLYKTYQAPFDPKTLIQNEFSSKGGKGTYKSGREPFYSSASVERVLRCIGCGDYNCPHRLGMYIAYRNAQSMGLVSRIYDKPDDMKSNDTRRRRMFVLSCTALYMDIQKAEPFDCCDRLCDAFYPMKAPPAASISLKNCVVTINDAGNGSDSTIDA
jgi:hypothetical protein